MFCFTTQGCLAWDISGSYRYCRGLDQRSARGCDRWKNACLPSSTWRCFHIFELAAGEVFPPWMELSLLPASGGSGPFCQVPGGTKMPPAVLTDYWLFWGFSLYLFLDALGVGASGLGPLLLKNTGWVGLMAVLTLLGALLDSREAIDRVFATLALAAVAAALLSVLEPDGCRPLPSRYDLRLSLRRGLQHVCRHHPVGVERRGFAAPPGSFRQNRGILLLIAGVYLPPVPPFRVPAGGAPIPAHRPFGHWNRFGAGLEGRKAAERHPGDCFGF